MSPFPLGILGSARVGSTFDPSDIAGLVGWFDASDSATVTLVSSKVSQFADKSGNGRHLTQGTDTNRPTYADTINGLSAITFGSPTYLERTSAEQWVNASTGQWTAFGVMTSSASGAQIGFVSVDPPRVAPQMVRSYDAAVQAIGHVGSTGTYVGDFSASTLSSGVPFLVTGQQRSDAVEGWVDGATNGATSTGTPLTATTQALMGRLNADYLAGKIGEVLVYNTALGSTDRQAVENYLMTKWGI